MPRYKKDVKRKITEDETRALIDSTSNKSHKAAIAILYLTGARPSEVAVLKKEDLTIEEGLLKVSLVTKKGGIDRTLFFEPDDAFIQEVVLPYVDSLPAGSFLFGFSGNPDRLKHVVYEASDRTVAPYTFRHSRLTQLAESGYTQHELMMWKGARTMESVNDYLYKSMRVNLKKRSD